MTDDEQRKLDKLTRTQRFRFLVEHCDNIIHHLTANPVMLTRQDHQPTAVSISYRMSWDGTKDQVFVGIPWLLEFIDPLDDREAILIALGG